MSGNDHPPAGMAPDLLAAALDNPPGDEEENALCCDAYALWAAMTRLGHEVKLQGRAFAALREQVADGNGLNPDDFAEKIAGAVEDSLTVFQERTDATERRIEAARQRAERNEEDLLTTLADVHDRLARSLDVARSRLSPKLPWLGWIHRLFFRSSAVSRPLIEGQELALRRVADELARRGLREISVLGGNFDPEVMRAVATDSSGRTRDGMVTAVVRGGWRRGEDVWRAAEVTVAKKQ